jgi:hypothetical protein
VSQQQPPKPSRLPLYFVGGILLLFTLGFAVAFVLLSESSEGTVATTLTPDTYMDIVTPLLANAEAARGAALVEHYACVGCHRAGAEATAHIAPPFVGLAERAANRRPPLSAEAYIYESILYPAAYHVGDYTPVMPQNYGRLISESELGDIIAFLLSPGAH